MGEYARSTRAAAQTLARLLKKRCNIHVMLFGLPAAGDRTGETYWVRPCCQIYNSRSDYETLGHKVLEWAPLASAADKALLWLRKVRPNVGELAEREEEEVNTLCRSRSLHVVSLPALWCPPVESVFCSRSATIMVSHCFFFLSPTHPNGLERRC
jgi:hypothetical protein